eukprot:GHVO01015886.1.p1 GENE.GHVO01015886.1~~GHVO01015886.1.p1  ORF type:complete len:194 (+),score=24.77 GHVO01015886.1:128-709(+)
MLSGISSYLFGSSPDADDSFAAPPPPPPADLPEGQDDLGRLMTREEDEEWVLVDKAATAGSARSDPLENLLIEHPSMSVYSLRGRGNSIGEESEESDEEDPAASASSQRRLQPSLRPHPLAMNSTTAPLVCSKAASMRSMQKAVIKHEQQRLKGNFMQRNNRVQKHNNTCRRPRRSDRMMRHSGRNNNRNMLH